ncbi:hypothetical protein [Primorskyibacter sp. 2E233]|uniref:hypothetical protein n=1 Tax=Primorskyibacter sp. 2E233 TaxID=3413431 RepID=UPI003BEFF487
MAIFGFLIGSVIGLFAAVLGWLFWDISALQALAIYLGSGIGLGLLLIANGCLRQQQDHHGPRQVFS